MLLNHQCSPGDFCFTAKYMLITDENDATDYMLLWFDKYGTEIND